MEMGIQRESDSSSRQFLHARDVRSLGMLVLVVVAAWCFATGKGISARWDMPSTYVDATYSDFLGMCGYLQSLHGWAALPYGPKVASDLAAPDTLNWNAIVTTDEAVQFVFSTLIRVFGLFTGFNLGVLLGHVAAAVTFYLVARTWLDAVPLWSFLGGLAFGLAPYLFAEAPHHITCQYCWHLPLFPVVWAWVATDSGLRWRSRRFWQACAIALVTGIQNPYYTLIFCQLTLLGGAVAAWREQSRAALLTAVAVVGVAAAGFFVGNVDTIAYRMTHGSGDSPIVAEREYKWMDIYGFKLVDMFIPWVTHHSQAFAKFGLAHRQASVLNDEEGCAYLGLLGIACLLFLVSVSMRALIEGRSKDVPHEVWWVLWIVLFFNTGGLNALIASFTGFTLFRTGIRYAVMILVIVLLFAVRRLSVWQRDCSDQQSPEMLQIAVPTAAAAACLLVLWDQVPRGPTTEQTALIEAVVESDRAFVHEMETALPEKAMVFQLPVMEGRPVRGVANWDHYRPSLYSQSLHWSNGALSGTKTLAWQQALQRRMFQGSNIHQELEQVRLNGDNVREAVDELRDKGFAAIYLNRNGFPDRGQSLMAACGELGYQKPPIVSAAGDLACIFLVDSAGKAP